MNIINDFDKKQVLWRYIKPDSLIDILEKEEIYFSAATQFIDDPFEGAISIKPYGTQIEPNNIFEHAFSELRRLTKISCWHMSECENDAMWKLYANSKKGLAITTTVETLIESLEPYKIESTYATETLNIGKVTYVNLMDDKIDISMLNRFFFKHNAFSWEKEFRLTISLRMAEELGASIPENGIFVKLKPKVLIKNIYLGPSMNKKERDRIIHLCKKHNLEDKLRVSSLLGTPLYS